MKFPSRNLNTAIKSALSAGLLAVFVGCAPKNNPSDTVQNPILLPAVHPMFLEMPVPSGGIEVNQNPPILRRPAVKGKDVVYEILLSQDSTFKNTTPVKTRMAVYNPHRKLENGAWYWQYRKEGADDREISKFIVTEAAVPVVSPEADELIQSIPAEHPRTLIGKNEISALRSLSDNADAQAVIADAKKYLDGRIPREKDAYATRKVDDKRQQRKLDQDASQNLSSSTYDRIVSLTQAYLLTGRDEYATPAIAVAMEVASWNPDGITQLSDFGDARCMLGMALVFDTFYDRLDADQKEKLVKAVSHRAARFYDDWINNIEAKVLSGHVWQHILHYFFQTAISLHGETPAADDWLRYAYELFIARAPVLGGFDGGWVEGVSYFRMNMETMIDIPLFIKKFTGFDFINAHPWYKENIRWAAYHIPPGSSADGFGDNTEEVFSPGAEYIAYAEETAKLTGDTLASWYARECRKYEQPDLSKTKTLRWVRLAKTRNLPLPEYDRNPVLPTGAVFRDAGLAAMHNDIAHTPTDLAVTFKSSPFGSYGHILCDQNTFNILYGGKRIFYRTGYKVTMDDPHRTGWYRTTKSQNGMLIDGQGQPYGSDAFGVITRFLCDDEIAYAKGDATSAYKSEKDGFDAGVRRFFRHIVLLKPDLVIVYDETEAEKNVLWSWLIHSLSEMTIDTARHTFSVRTPDAVGIGKLYASGGIAWSLTDTFDVAAVNWRESKHADGRLKSYNAPQWNLTASGKRKSSAMRFLAVLQVSPGADADKRAENIPANGNVIVTAGDWDISAVLDTGLSPNLIIRKRNGKTVFAAYSDKSIPECGKTKHTGSSVIVRETNGKNVVREAGDVLPQSVKNVILTKNK